MGILIFDRNLKKIPHCYQAVRKNSMISMGFFVNEFNGLEPKIPKNRLVALKNPSEKPG